MGVGVGVGVGDADGVTGTGPGRTRTRPTAGRRPSAGSAVPAESGAASVGRTDPSPGDAGSASGITAPDSPGLGVVSSMLQNSSCSLAPPPASTGGGSDVSPVGSIRGSADADVDAGADGPVARGRRGPGSDQPNADSRDGLTEPAPPSGSRSTRSGAAAPDSSGVMRTRSTPALATTSSAAVDPVASAQSATAPPHWARRRRGEGRYSVRITTPPRRRRQPC